MKMKEVCALTGLTERTVRFYVGEGLVSPKTTRQNGRDYREYSTQDVDLLKTIASLRKFHFTIEEIKSIQRRPKDLPALLEDYRLRIVQEAEEENRIVQTLQEVDLTQAKDLASLARLLRPAAESLTLPASDVTPDFEKFEDASKEEKEEGYQKYLKAQERRYRIGKWLVFAIAIYNLGGAVYNLVVSFSGGRILGLILNAVVSIALMLGYAWARWVFVGSLGLSIIVWFSLLTEAGLPSWLIIWSLVQLAISIGSAVLLFANKCVSEFFYTSQNE